MKKTIILLVMLISLTAQGQILFKDSLNINQPTISYEMNFSQIAGDRYVLKPISFDSNIIDPTIKIYNADYSLNRTINLSLPDYGIIRYVSMNLFDTDDDYEFMYVNKAGETDHVVIYNEDSSILYDFEPYPDHSAYTSIYKTSDDLELVIYYIAGNSNNKIYTYYSLPGEFPCDYCDNISTKIENYTDANSSFLAPPYPNPTSNFVQIEYKLPDSETTGYIVIYNINGIELKRYMVDDTFDHLRISTEDFPSGTYYYNLETLHGVSSGKKIIVIK